MSKTLVAYFSASGVTAKLAKALAEAADAELFEIKPVPPYTDADLDWNDTQSRSTKEMKDKAFRPSIAEKVSGIDAYDTVFVGFPIWWYEAPRIIQAFLESYDFSGKNVIAFATSGGSGMGKTDSILKASCPSANWKTGKRMNANASSGELKEWIASLKL